MKLKVNQDRQIEEAEIVINCPLIDTRIRNIIDCIRQCTASLSGTIGEVTVHAPLDSILYIESVDRKTFFYDTKRAFRCSASLSVLEDQLEDYLFARISKSCIVNITKVSSFYHCDNDKLGILLNNGERLVAGRTYAEDVQNKIKSFHIITFEDEGSKRAAGF